MSDQLPAPHFDPSGPAPGFSAERRRRLLLLAGGALVLALVGSSAANASRASLRCVDGRLVPFEGRMLPVGEEPLHDDAFPPLRMAAAACEDEEFESHDAFEERYVELAFSQVEPGEGPQERLAAESAIDAIDAMTELPAGASEQLQQRRRALLHSVVEQKVDDVRQSQQEALQWIERARRAGADPAVLRAAERSLGLPPLGGSTLDPSVDPTAPEPEPEPEDPPQLRAVPAQPPPSRHL